MKMHYHVSFLSFRFEHSIGVAYLALQMANSLRTKLKEELKAEVRAKRPHSDLERRQISGSDVLCVTLAGLCHDLGHGPFSHMWDAFILPALGVKDCHHEDFSVMMFRERHRTGHVRFANKAMSCECSGKTSRLCFNAIMPNFWLLSSYIANDFQRYLRQKRQICHFIFHIYMF